MERCVYTGVDGLGIGTSLHYIDSETKLMGAFNPDAIHAVLEARTKAESTVKGRGAVLLARLDRLKYENLLSEEEDNIRMGLFQAICRQDEDQIAKILEDEDYVLAYVMNMEDDSDNDIIARGRRTLRYTRRVGNTRMQRILKKAIENRDVDTLDTIFKTQFSGKGR